MIEVKTVEAMKNYGLMLVFNNGEHKYFDMRPYLQVPVFRCLENSGFFSLARVDYGTVTWPGDIDIAPETLYEYSVLQTDEKKE